MSDSNRPMMRAISQDDFGGPEVLHEATVPRPKPRMSQIVVRVRAAGLNPTDWKHRGTKLELGDPPLILGWDVAGVVEKTGPGVTLFEPGDEVMGMLPYSWAHGSHAEYAVGPTRAFVRKPESLSFVQAGALPLASLAAWQSLVDTANIAAGEKVLIHAAAGGVGHLAVQIAKARGAYVIGTASEPKHDFLRSLGADELIDYHSLDFAEVVHDADMVFDTIGGDHQLRSLHCLRKGGIMVSTIPVPAEGLYTEAERLRVRAQLIYVEADHAGMQAIADLADSGQLTATTSQTFPLAQAARAHEAGETNRTTGKIVLTVD